MYYCLLRWDSVPARWQQVVAQKCSPSWQASRFGVSAALLKLKTRRAKLPMCHPHSPALPRTTRPSYPVCFFFLFQAVDRVASTPGHGRVTGLFDLLLIRNRKSSTILLEIIKIAPLSSSSYTAFSYRDPRAWQAVCWAPSTQQILACPWCLLSHAILP